MRGGARTFARLHEYVTEEASGVRILGLKGRDVYVGNKVGNALLCCGRLQAQLLSLVQKKKIKSEIMI
jgi:hypothetical protein